MKLHEFLAKLMKDAGARVREALSADSLEGRADKLREAWNTVAPSYDWYVVDVFDDAIVVRNMSVETEYRRVPYTVAGDAITFAAPEAVAVEYVPIGAVAEARVREAGQAELTKPLDVKGLVWEARILRFGTSHNGWHWTREAGEELVKHLDGAPVCLYATGQHAPETVILANNGPVKENVVGVTRKPRVEADGVYAEVHIAEAHAALRDRLLEIAKTRPAGQDKTVGLSVDTWASYIPVRLREGVARAIKSIKRLISTDIVDAPSADGGLLRATAGPVPSPKEDPMNREELLALIREHRPLLLEGKDVAKLTDAEISGFVREALKTPPPVVVAPEPKKPAVTEPSAEPVWAREARAREVKVLVREALAATKLPELVQAKLRKQLEARVVEADGMPAFAKDLEASVKEEVELFAKLSPTGDPTGFGAGRIEITAAPLDKVTAAMDRMFRVHEAFGKAHPTVAAALDVALVNAPFLNTDTTARVKESMKSSYEASKDAGLVFKGIRHAYQVITGDEDVSGLLRQGRASEAILSTTWAQILQDAMYKRMLMDYIEPQFNERSIAMYGRAEDFRTKHVNILNYFADIDTVDPESADYTEIAEPGDDEVTYAVTQRGNILTISRKAIINDDLRAISKLVGRLGRAARRTLAKFIWNFWVANSAYDVDAVAWFNSAHGNTGSTALTADATGATEVLAKITQLINMTEQGSGEKLGMPPMEALWLDVPPALYGVARMLNLTQYFGTTAANPVYGWFGAPERGERINVNTLLTDTTDWGLHVTPGAGGRESIVVDFLQGREEPEFFLADQPTAGQAFVGDKNQYKLRHEYGGDITDFRGAVKNVVAGA